MTKKKALLGDPKWDLAAIVSISDAGIAVMDEKGVVRQWNNGAEKIFGYKAEEIIGKSMKTYVPEASHSEIDDIINSLKNGEHIVHTEVVRKHKDNRNIDCSSSYTPVFDESGQLIGFVTVSHDISEKKRMERALEQAVRAAEEASQAKSMFLANMSHEMRILLGGVIGFAELAQDESAAEKIHDYLNKICLSAHGLTEIINDVLDISKIEAGAMVLEQIAFDLHEIFRFCEVAYSPKAMEKGIELYFYAEPFIGKRLVGDPVRLRQVLMNLLSNALKFTYSGTIKLSATVLEQKSEEITLCFEVKDSGIGMSEQQIKEVFKPFSQAESSTTRRFGGSGLGLTITKSIVEMMGGELAVESLPDMGSRFFFTITLATINEPETAVLESEAPPLIQKPIFTGEVLVCEDNTINQEVIAGHLERVGLNVIIVNNGRLGVEAVRTRMEEQKPFDLILMDIHMPVMDGLEAAQRINDLGSETPIIAMTANAMITDKENYLRQGMADYISKPFTAQKLWQCLLKYLKPMYTIPVDEGTDRTHIDSTAATRAVMSNDEGDTLDEALGRAKTGDAKIYRRIQRNFVKDNHNAFEELNKALSEGDIKRAYRIAHTLKGVAELLSAPKLARAAKAVEVSLAQEEAQCTAEQLNALNAALKQILGVLEPRFPLSEARRDQGSEPVDRSSALQIVCELWQLLEAGDSDSLDLLDEAAAILAPFGEVYRNLVEQVENYEFEAALEILREIKALLE